MRILVTGGAGYIGGTCTRKLIKDGHTVWVFDNLHTGILDSRLYQSSVVEDIRHYNVVLDTLRTFKPDAVLHFAALTSVPESISNPQDYWDTNLVGTFNLLKAMHECRIRRLISSSTAAVYAPDDEAVTENSLLAPATPYGKSKLAAEFLIQDFSKAYGIDYTIFRYFNVGGADDDYLVTPKHEAHVIPLLLKTALGEQKEFTVFGNDYKTADGTCLRDYIHVNDVVEAHLKALASLGAVNQLFNLGSERAHSVIEVLEACEEVTGKTIPYVLDKRRSGDAPVLYACSAHARLLFGWKPQHSLHSILKSAYQAYLRR